MSMAALMALPGDRLPCRAGQADARRPVRTASRRRHRGPSTRRRPGCPGDPPPSPQAIPAGLLPGRFSTTPHYGPPHEPGGVITRLAENRRDDELQELEVLLEQTREEVAPAELLAQRQLMTAPQPQGP